MNYLQYILKGGHWRSRFRAVRVPSIIEEYGHTEIYFAGPRLCTGV